MPFFMLPLVRSHSSSPGVAVRMRSVRRLGCRLRPVPSSPWQDEQFLADSLPPAACASGLLSKGFCFARAFSGTLAIHRPSPEAALNAAAESNVVETANTNTQIEILAE